MRARLLSVAALAFALFLPACTGADSSTPEVSGSDPGEGSVAATISVTGTDSLAFEPDVLSVVPGEVTVELTAESAPHTVVIEGVGSEEPIVEASGGETGTGTVTLEAGTYTFFCDVPGHREAGMEGTLEVEG